MNLILASASPRRKKLIRKIAGLHVKVIPGDVDENIVCDDPVKFAVKLAELKAESVHAKHGGIVLGADTIVVLDGEILNKPKTFAEAENMFVKLCGKTHEVITGICIVDNDKKVVDFEITKVTFGEFNAPLIHAYITGGAPFDKAGGYGIQDPSMKDLILNVDGDFDNVIGLPVAKVEKLLEQFGR